MRQVDVRDHLTLSAWRIDVERGEILTRKPLDAGNREILPILVPGLCDVQINGYAGTDFNSDTLEEAAWHHAVASLLRDGCSAFCATLITCPLPSLQKRMRRICELMQNTPQCIGIHLEGPYLNPDTGTRGIHPEKHMLKKNLLTFLGAIAEYLDHVHLITLAPESIEENERAAFLSQCQKKGIRVCAGHSSARGNTLRDAINEGLFGWTHLGNAIGRNLDKFEYPFWDVLAHPHLRASLIPDSWHLPPAAFRVIAFALHTRMILTTDASAVAGSDHQNSLFLNDTPIQIKISSENIECEPAPLPMPIKFWGHWLEKKLELDWERHASFIPHRPAKVPRVVNDENRLAGSALRPLDAVWQAAWMLQVPWTLLWDTYSTQVFSHWLNPNLPRPISSQKAFYLVTPPQPTDTSLHLLPLDSSWRL